MIVLPWPPKELSLNARVHPQVRARVGAKYREACFWLTKEAQERLSGDRVHMTITFFQPDRRRRDLDNMLSACKHGLDGVADALGVNDSIFRPVTLDVADEIGGMVKIQFSNA